MAETEHERTSLAAFWRSHPRVLCGLLLLLAGNALLPFLYRNHSPAMYLDYACVFALAFWTAGLACRRARHEGPAAFRLLGLGAALGGLRYAPTLLPFPHEPINGSVFSILGLLSLGMGFLTWPQQVRMPRERIRTTLDALVLVLSMFTVAWVAMGSMDMVGQLPRGRMLIYLLQISVCLSLLAFWLLQETGLGLPEQAQAKRYVRRALILLFLHSSLVVVLRVTGHYRQNYLGHAAELLHQIANVFLALAALSPSTAPGTQPDLRKPSPLRALIPSMVALAVLCLIAIQVFRPQAVAHKPLLGLGLGLMAILMIRHGLLILDLERLSHGLEARVEERTRELEIHHREALNGLRVRMMAGLAAGLVHDLNNLLATIRLRLGLLRETCTVPQLVSVDILEDASERAIAMTRRILMSSRLQDLSPVVFDLTEWMEGRSGLLRALLLEGQRLELQMTPDLHVFADTPSLEQIFQNLVSNARDAMGPTGTLRILATSQPGFARLEVRDDGPGIPSDHMANVFEPFFTTKPSGTGLGLATVRNLVLQNHGAIHIETGPSQGTAFILELPIPH